MQDKKIIRKKAINEISNTRKEYHREDGELRATIDEKTFDLYKKLESWIYDQLKHVEECILLLQPLASDLRGKNIGTDSINSLWKEHSLIKSMFEGTISGYKYENTDDIIDQTYILAFQQLVPIAHRVYEIRSIIDNIAGTYLFDES